MEFPGVPIFPGYGKQKNAITRYWGDGVSRFHPNSVQQSDESPVIRKTWITELYACLTDNGATRIVLLVTDNWLLSNNHSWGVLVLSLWCGLSADGPSLSNTVSKPTCPSQRFVDDLCSEL